MCGVEWGGGGGVILHFIANYWTETIRGFSIYFFLPLERSMYFCNELYIFEMLFHPLYITTRRYLNNVFIVVSKNKILYCSKVWSF